MAGAIKHMARSHRSNRDYKPFNDFERKAKVKKANVERKNFFTKLFHRNQSK